jgi:hypothetical protein
VIRGAIPSRAPRVSPQQIGGDARFVHKHLLPRIMDRHRLRPPPPGHRNVRSTLFVGGHCFF